TTYYVIIIEAIVLLDEFRAGRQCLDDFIEGAGKDLQNMDAVQKKFILDVVSGCVEHKKLLDVVISGFYGQNGKRLSRGDDSQFVVICYLVTFILDDLGLENFSNIVRSLDTKNIHTFFSFFFSNLTTWIKKEWSSIYDAAFVEKHWIGPLLRWRPEIDILMNKLAVKLSQENQVKKAPIKTTETQEFSLSKPKPRPLPPPEIIPQQEKYKPVPNSTYRAPKEMQIIEEIKEKNHQKAEVRCPILLLSSEKDSCRYNVYVCCFLFLLFCQANSCPIKLNKTAILRREALCDRQVEEELQRYRTRLVRGDREPLPPLPWQTERRHLEGRIVDEEAAVARQRITERNQKTAQLKKEETAQLMRSYAEKRLQEEKALRDLVQQVAEGHKNSKTAKEKLQKLKQSIVKEVSGQSQELLRQALEEAQAELSRKFEIIQEIHAIESLPHVRVKNFDDTETAGHKLLGEMSLVELKERLNLAKATQQAEQEDKRRCILEEKQKKKQQLQETLETIDLHGRALARTAAIRSGKLSTKPGTNKDSLLSASEPSALFLCFTLVAVNNTHLSSLSVCFCQRSLKEKSWEELEQSLARHIREAS
uniref:Cilia and flagella associated protein 99 n=1 Tax=Stegastes partitus TaxID=144197 RepID=A0A3B5A6H4_9TELE